MFASCARCNAPPARSRSADHERSFEAAYPETRSPRPARRHWRPYRRLQLTDRHEPGVGGPGAGSRHARSQKGLRRQVRRRDRCRRLSRHRRPGPRHAVLRQGRTRHRRRDRAHPDGRRGARRPARPCHGDPGRHRADPGPGPDLRLEHDPEGRPADPAGGGDRPSRAARRSGEPARRPRRQPRGDQRNHREQGRRRQIHNLCRADRRQEVRCQTRCEGAIEEPGRLHDRRQIRRSPRHSGEVHRRLHLHAGRQGTGHAAWPRRAATGHRRHAAERRRGLGQRHPRSRQNRARGQFPRNRREERVVGDQGGQAAEGDMVALERPPRPGQALGACARDQIAQGRGDEQHRQRGRRAPRRAPSA